MKLWVEFTSKSMLAKQAMHKLLVLDYWTE